MDLAKALGVGYTVHLSPSKLKDTRWLAKKLFHIQSSTPQISTTKKNSGPAKGIRDLSCHSQVSPGAGERQGEGKAQLLPGKKTRLWLQASCQFGEGGPVGAPLQFAHGRAIALSGAKCSAELPVPGEGLLLSAAPPPFMQCQGTGGREGGISPPWQLSQGNATR